MPAARIKRGNVSADQPALPVVASPAEAPASPAAGASVGKQGLLLDVEGQPLRHDLVELVRSGRHKHTGQRLLGNEHECQRLVELLQAKWGLKRIARALGVSKWSVRAARQALVERGEMAPWKERVVAMMEDFAEAGLARMVDGVEDGTMPVGQIPVPVGIVLDKRRDAVGEPSAAGAGPIQVQVLTVEAAREWLRGLSSEGQSTGTVEIQAKVESLPPPAATFAATSDGPGRAAGHGPEVGAAGDLAVGGGGGSDDDSGENITMEPPASSLDLKPENP